MTPQEIKITNGYGLGAAMAWGFLSVSLCLAVAAGAFYALLLSAQKLG